jgi:hypothetical protein
MNKIKEINEQEIKKNNIEINPIYYNYVMENDIKKFENIFPNFVNKLNQNIKINNNNINTEQNINNIIYGDYLERNSLVEVFLHQRTMKKVKYKKREFDAIHPINKDVIEKVKQNLNKNTTNNNKKSYVDNTRTKSIYENIKQIYYNKIY